VVSLGRVDRPYPSHWEADVVLRDGGTAHLRPIRPDDADRLVRFMSRLSDETIYFRFFSMYRQLSARDLARFTEVDHVDRAALIATIGDEMIGVVRYDRVSPQEAEVAFTIEDSHQGRGLGSVFLEHIAAAARERGIARFVADVMPANRKMLNVFSEAGYSLQQGRYDGVVRLEFALAPTASSTAVTQAREHRADARSVQRLLSPRSVAVVGVSRSPHSIGRTVLHHLQEGGYLGQTYAVTPHVAGDVDGAPAYATVTAAPGPVDLALLAVPADQIESVVADCAAKGVLGLVIMSSGFAETGDEGRARQLRVVQQAHANGMRVIGPSSFGLLNTDPDVSLNASLSPLMPEAGRVGFFSQSGALGVALLDNIVRRGLGISTFVSAGNRVDVSGNDLLQYWEEDPRTDAVMLYLESIGNPRKFSRIARRMGRTKPVVVVTSGRSGRAVPHGHVVRETRAPKAAVAALFEQAGVIGVDNIHELFDVGQLVANQPLPAGPRVAVLGNSDALGVLAADACASAGLELVGEPRQLGADASADDFRAALEEVFADAGVDSVVALFIPPLVTPDEDVARVLAEGASRSDKTVVSTFLGMRGVPEALRVPGGRGSVPSYSTPEDAVAALAAVTRYAAWRTAPAGELVRPAGVDPAAARRLVQDALRGLDDLALDAARVRQLLTCYGVTVRSGADVDGPQAAGLSDAVACVVTTMEDPLFGPVLSFGLAGVATDLLGDWAYRIPPLTDRDVHELVRSVRAAPLLFGHNGAPAVDVVALEDLLARVGQLADDLPEVADLRLDPVLVGVKGVIVLGAQVLLSRSPVRTDRVARTLRG
jgi:acyl-CoA synthetase (NDP forming)/RimJ/RimL family protein N-acetyltransferase